MNTAVLAPTDTTRSAAIIAGVGLAAMAVLAPIAVFAAAPAGLTALAGLIILLVVVLDVIVAYALSAALDPQGGILARVTTGLRLVYAAAFAVAATQLVAGDEAAFQTIWDAALLVFAAHLLAVALLGWRTRALPWWVSVLVAIAGLGYLIDALAPLFTLGFEVSTVSFVGEVALLLYLLIRGGRPAARKG